ncbi:MAG: TonB-dependent receptor, partial [Moraxellaceae bacterium]
AFDSAAAPASQSFSEEMYEGGISQQLTSALTASLGASRSVRLGTVDESYEYNAFFQREFSPLRPQIGHNLEGSLAYAQGKHRISATVYDQKLEDEIQFSSATFTNDNIDPTQRRGATLGVTSEVVQSVTVNASLTHQRARFRSGPLEGNDVPLVPGNLGHVNVNWQATPMWSVALTDTYTGSQFFENDQSNSFGQKIPSFHRIDTRLGWQWKQLNAALTVSNLADEDDTFSYGVRSGTVGRYNAYPLPGREYRFDVGMNF